MRTVYLAIILSACGSSSSSTKTPDAQSADGKSADAMVDAPTDVKVTLPGGADALLWDATASKLYLTDDTNLALLSWDETDGIKTVATLPTETAGDSFGSILKQADGSFLVVNFGFGTQGGIFSVPASGSPVTMLTGLDMSRRRVQVATDSNGLMYTSYFTGKKATAVGGVATLTITGTAATESEIDGVSTESMMKAVIGLAATPTALYASDQVSNAIFKITVPDYTESMLATITAPDLLFMLPNGDMLTGGSTTISRITQTGTVTAVTLPATFGDVEGIEYDPAGHHLFVIDHSTAAGTPDILHVLPFMP